MPPVLTQRGGADRVPPMIQLTHSLDHWTLHTPLVISRRSIPSVDTVLVRLTDGTATGQGEAAGVNYHGETMAVMAGELDAMAEQLVNGLTREALREAMPPGGSRNAIDAALWDLEAKQSGQSVWQRLNMVPQPVITAATIGIGTPDVMATTARGFAGLPLLKLKLNAEDPVARVAAVRAARPDARLIVDANESWSVALVEAIAPALAALGVEMIEQPVPAGQDALLAGVKSPLPIGADESCQTLADIDRLAPYYNVINIKLDKCGGLTEALMMVDRAKALGLDLMVGCMVSTSLSMAPAFVIAQHCRWVDLDGPILLASDRPHGMDYSGGMVSVPDARLWG
jgi:L-Ala-D/L-Glu epimerase